jgi:hypothetical protein
VTRLVRKEKEEMLRVYREGIWIAWAIRGCAELRRKTCAGSGG